MHIRIELSPGNDLELVEERKGPLGCSPLHVLEHFSHLRELWLNYMTIDLADDAGFLDPVVGGCKLDPEALQGSLKLQSQQTDGRVVEAISHEYAQTEPVLVAETEENGCELRPRAAVGGRTIEHAPHVRFEIQAAPEDVDDIRMGATFFHGPASGLGIRMVA